MVGNQSPLPLIDLYESQLVQLQGWESVTSPFDRLIHGEAFIGYQLGISHLSL